MTYALSFESMLRRLYARSAMARVTSTADTRPAALQPDHAPALRLLIRDAFATLCASIGTAVTATNIDDIDPETDPFITARLTLPEGTDGSATLALLEHAVALGALARVWNRHDLAEEAAEAARAVAALASRAPVRARIKPWP